MPGATSACPLGRLWVPNLPTLLAFPADPCPTPEYGHQAAFKGLYANAVRGAFNRTRPAPAPCRRAAEVDAMRAACGDAPFAYPDLPQQLGVEMYLLARLLEAAGAPAHACVTTDPAESSAVLLLPHMPHRLNLSPGEWSKHARGQSSCYHRWAEYLRGMWRLVAERAPQLRERRVYMVTSNHLARAYRASSPFRQALASRNFTPLAVWLGDGWRGRGWSFGHTGHFHPSSIGCLHAWQGILANKQPQSLMTYRGGSHGMQGALRATLAEACSSLPKRDCAASPETAFFRDYFDAQFCLMPAGDDPGRQGIWDALQAGCAPVFFGDAGARARTMFSRLRLGTPDADAWSVLIPESQLDELTLHTNASAFGTADKLLKAWYQAGGGKRNKTPLVPLRKYSVGGFFLPPITTTEADRQRVRGIGRALVRALEEVRTRRGRTLQQFIAHALPRFTFSRFAGPDAVVWLVEKMLRGARDDT